MNHQIKLILFDLGGVLIELGGVSTFMEWTRNRYSEDEIWNLWLLSPSVKRFETGRSTPDEFADSVIDEMNLPVSPKRFLDAFVSWPKGIYSGANRLLHSLRPSFELACLSNTNELHWQRILDEMNVTRWFSITFLSFQLGMLKPDPAIFEHVLKTTQLPGREILFLDDNQINVDTAVSVGISAFRVKGLQEVENKLGELNLIKS